MKNFFHTMKMTGPSLAVGAILLFGCPIPAFGQAQTATPGTSTQTGTSDKPFRISITPTHDVVKAGSAVCVLIDLVNSSQDLPISHVSVNGMDGQFRYEIRDEGGHLIPKKTRNPSLPTIADAHGNGTLKANDTMRTEQCPSMLYTLNKPGKYTVQVFRYISFTSVDGEIGSNIATITVEP